MKGFFTVAVTVVVFASIVAQYQPDSTQAVLEKLKHILHSYSTSKSGPGNATGVFAQDCRWRDAAPSPLNTRTAQGFWDVRYYEYWNETTQTWSLEQPSACRLQPLPFDMSSSLKKLKTPSSTRRRCDGDDYCIFENLWYNQGKFYYLTDDKDGMDSIALTRDITLDPLVVNDASLFPSQVDARIVPGSTVLIDFLYFIHPTAIGHWLEHLMPLVSAFRKEQQQQKQKEPTIITFPPDQILVLHLKRTHLIEWVRAVLAAAVNTYSSLSNDHDGNKSTRAALSLKKLLPPVYLQQEINSMWDQIGTPLEGTHDTQWICFEKVLVVKDTFSGGGRVATSPEDVEMFRKKVYEMHEMPPPVPVPARNSREQPTITVFRKSTNRRIVNEAAMLGMLSKTFADHSVRVVEFTTNTLFQKQLEIMASTDILVSTHTSALANLVFLPPGAVILELIHRNWVWSNLDSSFKAQSDARGDVHHWAWRAVKKEHGKYINPRDEQRFGGDEWAGNKCDTDDCVEAHTNIDVVVDVEAVEKLLPKRLSLIQQQRMNIIDFPWPPP